ncbi:MAG: 6-bladed beta-propeller, partial [Bacteroidales bacterium]
MKPSILILVLLALIGCRNSADTLLEQTITFDLNANYPQKELIYSDLFNTEYVKVENDSIKLNSFDIMNIHKDTIIGFYNKEIYIMNKKGKILNRIQKRGNGGDEYLSIRDAFYDTLAREIYVLDMVKKRAVIYNLNGTFSRSLNIDNKIERTTQIRDYDNNSFIAYNNTYGISDETTGQFTIISKKDGSV